MNKNKVLSLAAHIIGSAIIWGLVILGCALKLKGTDCYQQISMILAAGAGLHLILIWGPLAAQLRKSKDDR